MKKFPILFKRTQLGQIQTWQICVENDGSFFTSEGIKDGAITVGKPTICLPKNEGKANATDGYQQALKEAEAKHKKKLERGYTTDINKIDTCKTFFEPMLAKKLNDYKDDIKYPVIVQKKIDGSRLIAQSTGLTTRNGKGYPSCPHIFKTLEPVFKIHQSWVIDSEIYSHDVPFEKIMSLVRKSKPTAEDIKEAEQIVKIYIFDGVIDDKDADFETRYNTIKNEIIKIIGKSKHIVFVDYDIANSYEEIMKFHNEYVKMGFEGVIVRIPNTPYECRRSCNLLKYKVFDDQEFTIVDILEGIGQRSGMAGKIVVELKEPTTDGDTTCEAGLRGNEQLYIEIFKNRKQLIGKQATIRYQGFTEKHSLRFPVAININRFDV